jgi:hypothetical protein
MQGSDLGSMVARRDAWQNSFLRACGDIRVMAHVPHSSRAAALPSIVCLLVSIAAAIGAIDLVWAEKANFTVDVFGYARVIAVTGLCLAGGYLYQTRRPEPRLAAMLFGTGFLLSFSAAGSVLNAMLLVVAGPRVDGVLAWADRALGFDWPNMMHALADHQLVLWVLQCAYISLLPQIALAVIVLATLGRIASVYRFVLAVAIGALICIFIWTLFPAFGAMSVYHFDAATIARLHVPVDGAYGQTLIGMLHAGPGLISPNDMKGLIGFPSYHAVLAFLLIWYLRDVPWLRWPVLLLNSVVVLATPVEGGHHWVDVIAGVPVTLLAVFSARRIFHFASLLDDIRAKALAAKGRAATVASLL